MSVDPPESSDSLTLKQQLKYLDEVIASEEHFLDNLDSHLESLNEEEVSPQIRKKVFQGRREGRELNFDSTDYRRLNETDDEAE